MKRNTMIGCTAALMAAFILTLPLAAAAQEELPRETRLIRVTNVSLESAHTLAHSTCRNSGIETVVGDSPGSSTRTPLCLDVSVLEDENMLAITATPEVIDNIAALLEEFDTLPETRAFHIVVLAASRTGGPSADVPAAARAALDDISDFLPYTGYSVLGTGWLRTSRYGEITIPGLDDFSAQLTFRPGGDADSPLLIEEFRVYRREPVEQIVDGMRTTQMRSSRIVETTFTISRGETVVVGTSKLNGDDSALVVLLTAVQN